MLVAGSLALPVDNNKNVDPEVGARMPRPVLMLYIARLFIQYEDETSTLGSARMAVAIAVPLPEKPAEAVGRNAKNAPDVNIIRSSEHISL